MTTRKRKPTERLNEAYEKLTRSTGSIKVKQGKVLGVHRITDDIWRNLPPDATDAEWIPAVEKLIKKMGSSLEHVACDHETRLQSLTHSESQEYSKAAKASRGWLPLLKGAIERKELGFALFCAIRFAADYGVSQHIKRSIEAGDVKYYMESHARPGKRETRHLAKYKKRYMKKYNQCRTDGGSDSVARKEAKRFSLLKTSLNDPNAPSISLNTFTNWGKEASQAYESQLPH